MYGSLVQNRSVDVQPPMFDYQRAFSRNLGIVTPLEQMRLLRARVVIPGCGGVGGLHALTLARLGVGNFVLADFDQFELENINRQFAAKVNTLGRNKAEVLREEILAINPEATVVVHRDGLTPDNARAVVTGADAIIDSLDFFAFEARALLFRTGLDAGVPVVTAAPLGLSCALLVFTKDGMSFDDYFAIRATDSRITKAAKFGMGLAPRATHLKYIDPTSIDLAAGKGPSSVIAIDLCAALAAAEVLKLILERGIVKPAPYYRQYDTYRGTLRSGRLWWGNRNPWQRLKTWIALRFLLKQ